MQVVCILPPHDSGSGEADHHGSLTAPLRFPPPATGRRASALPCKMSRVAFPAARIEWEVDEKRQRIVDSWPADVDDSAARRDWGFAPRYDFVRAFNEYLVPTIRKRYSRQAAG